MLRTAMQGVRKLSSRVGGIILVWLRRGAKQFYGAPINHSLVRGCRAAPQGSPRLAFVTRLNLPGSLLVKSQN
jgi:hypothetical protein